MILSVRGASAATSHVDVMSGMHDIGTIQDEHMLILRERKVCVFTISST